MIVRAANLLITILTTNIQWNTSPLADSMDTKSRPIDDNDLQVSVRPDPKSLQRECMFIAQPQLGQ